MVKRWNSVVKPNSKVYHLGDVAMRKPHLTTMGRLNGSKRLIRGNHDVFAINAYRQYFTEIYGVRVLDDMILSHIPLHPDNITTRFQTNTHGHLHEHRVMREVDGVRQIDPRYYSVCVEQLDFTPIALEDLRLKIKAQQDEYDYHPKARAWGNGSEPKAS